MLFFIYFSEKSINIILSNFEKKLDEIELLLNDKEYETATTKSNELYDLWKKEVVHIHMILNHSDTNVMTEEILKLTQYTEEKEDAESLASLHHVKSLIDRIINGQSISAENIL
ncbi:MAG: DUF4363 family protein [Oscillospiraceae bacterium]|nr:DUF4363 family protein [Oscillospiraceae bacterium]